MPVSLPPVLPPQQAEVRQVDVDAAALGVVGYQGYRVHVRGPAALKGLPLRRLVADASSLSDAIRRLGFAAYAAGYPAARALYAAHGQDVHVLLVLGHVSRVEGDPRLAAFFDDAVGERPLRVTTLAPARLLADPHADRLALKTVPRLVDDGDGSTLLLDSQPGPGVGALRAEAGNAGIRFVGEYFAGIGATLADRWGDEFVVAARRSPPRWTEAGAAYEDQSLRAARATPLGALGLSALRVSFRRRIGGIDTDNRLTQYGASWWHPLQADLSRHVILLVAADHTDRRGEVEPADAKFFAERYASAHVALAYASSAYPARDVRLELESSFAVRRGFGDRDPALSAADLSYTLAQPALGVALGLPGNIRVRLESSAMLSRDHVPEQQQWVLGGAPTLAAWLPGVAAGDSGYGARLELRRVQAQPRYTLTPRLFVEHGRARLRTATIEQPSGAVTLTDAGAGLEFAVGTAVKAGVACATPLATAGIDDAAANAARVRWLFSLQLTLD